jgi:hypothetical protein
MWRHTQVPFPRLVILSRLAVSGWVCCPRHLVRISRTSWTYRDIAALDRPAFFSRVSANVSLSAAPRIRNQNLFHAEIAIERNHQSHDAACSITARLPSTREAEPTGLDAMLRSLRQLNQETRLTRWLLRCEHHTGNLALPRRPGYIQKCRRRGALLSVQRRCAEAYSCQ